MPGFSVILGTVAVAFAAMFAGAAMRDMLEGPHNRLPAPAARRADGLFVTLALTSLVFAAAAGLVSGRLGWLGGGVLMAALAAQTIVFKPSSTSQRETAEGLPPQPKAKSWIVRSTRASGGLVSVILYLSAMIWTLN